MVLIAVLGFALVKATWWPAQPPPSALFRFPLTERNIDQPIPEVETLNSQSEVSAELTSLENEEISLPQTIDAQTSNLVDEEAGDGRLLNVAFDLTVPDAAPPSSTAAGLIAIKKTIMVNGNQAGSFDLQIGDANRILISRDTLTQAFENTDTAMPTGMRNLLDKTTGLIGLDAIRGPNTTVQYDPISDRLMISTTSSSPVAVN